MLVKFLYYYTISTIFTLFLTLLPTASNDFLSYGGGGGVGDFYPTPQKTMLRLSEWFEIWYR